jgi:ribosomal protein S18 acetylase RimI-like enzyme
MIGRRRFEAKTREAVDSDLALVRSLFREYASEIQIDLGFQNFEAELASLPGPYAPPAGAILLAEGSPHSAPLGVVAIRPLLGDTCEMKRRYIRPEVRGAGIGAMLVDAAVADARRRSYSKIVLDTLPHMNAAIHLYESKGFRPRAVLREPESRTVL